MARDDDDGDTRDKLTAAAAHLFARRGIESVPLRDVGAAAGQRNASAVQYHFGGRWDLVTAILSRHAETASPGEHRYAGLSIEEIVESLVTLLRPKLADAEGRDFLRVVFELTMRYPDRRNESRRRSGMPGLVKRVESLLDGVPPRIARARALSMTQFVTQQMAERARLIDEGDRRMLGEELFVANLREMATAMLLAPAPTGRRGGQVQPDRPPGAKVRARGTSRRAARATDPPAGGSPTSTTARKGRRT